MNIISQILKININIIQDKYNVKIIESTGGNYKKITLNNTFLIYRHYGKPSYYSSFYNVIYDHIIIILHSFYKYIIFKHYRHKKEASNFCKENIINKYKMYNKIYNKNYKFYKKLLKIYPLFFKVLDYEYNSIEYLINNTKYCKFYKNKNILIKNFNYKLYLLL